MHRSIPHDRLHLHIFTLLQLFHFDLEVQPILEVLVGKTVEQALLEVMEEEELASLRQQQVPFMIADESVNVQNTLVLGWTMCVCLVYSMRHVSTQGPG